MRLVTAALLMGLGFSSFANNDFETILPCGGDGPTPLSVATNPIEATVQTRGNVQEFQVWEGRNQVVYRNDFNEIYRLDLASGKNLSVAQSSLPLTHFAEPKERYLLTESGSWFFDVLGGKRWIQFNRTVPTMEHVFWEADDLYAVANTIASNGRQTLRVHRYTAGDNYSVPLCGDLNFDPGRGYALAKGHVFPNVFLYQTTKLSQGTIVNLFRLNVLNCDVKEISTFKHVVEGPVQAVYHFAKQNANAVKIDHPTRNWMWDPGNGSCQFFDIGNVPPILVNNELPVIATWSTQNTGLTLFDFRHPSQSVPKTTVLKNMSIPINAIGANDLYLTRDGSRIYVRPVLGYGSQAPIYKVGIRDFLSGSR